MSNTERPATTGLAEDAAPFSAAGFPRAEPRVVIEIGKDGRIVIPAAMRALMGIKDGSKLVLAIDGETLEVFTPEAGLRRAQAIVRSFVPRSVSMVDDLLADRRREVEDEGNG